MRRELRSQRRALEGLLAEFEPGVLDGLDAVAIVKEVAKIKSVCAAVEAGAVRRIDGSNVWRAKGYRSAAHLVASVTGTSVGSATNMLQTAERLANSSTEISAVEMPRSANITA